MRPAFIFILGLLILMPVTAHAVSAPKGFDGFSIDRLRPDPPAAPEPKSKGKEKAITFLGVSDDAVAKGMRKRLGEKFPVLYSPKNIYAPEFILDRFDSTATNGLLNAMNRFASAAGYDGKTSAVAFINMKAKPSFKAACLQGNKFSKDASWLVKWPVTYVLEQGKRKKQISKNLWVVYKIKFRGSKISRDEFTHFSDRPGEACVLPVLK